MEFNQKTINQLVISYLLKSNEFRSILGFVMANLIISIHAFYSGLIIKNSHLNEQSFDCCMHALILCCIFYAGIRAKHSLFSPQYPYGLQKLETLSALTMCLYILMISLIQIMRKINQFFEQSEILSSLAGIYNIDNPQKSPILTYNYIRIFISLVGLLQFVDYALILAINHKYAQRDEQYSRFIRTYKDLIDNISEEPYYEQHYINMHALFLFFLSDCAEYSLSSVIKFHAMGLIILMLNLFIIFVNQFVKQKLFVRSLLKSTSYALLVACDDQEDYKPLLNQLCLIEGIQNVKIKVWGSVSKKSRESIIELELFQPELAQQIRKEARELIDSQFQKYWISIT